MLRGPINDQVPLPHILFSISPFPFSFCRWLTDTFALAQVFKSTMSTDGFDMAGVGTALKDVTKVVNNTLPAKNEEAHNLAREKGWVEPQEFDYDTYNAAGTKAAAREIGQSEWAHSAEKYEWKEEYGDVGPPSAALEAQLFRSEFTNRRGLKFDK